MDQKLLNVCESVVNNRTAYYEKMKWETEANYCAIVAALMASEKGKAANVEAYMECKKLLKTKVNAFNEFRGIVGSMVITKMTLQANPEEYIDGCIEVYNRLRAIHKLTASPFMVLAAITIYENGGLEKADENIERLENLYKELKGAHPLLISDQDRAYLAMLVAFSNDTLKISEDIENSYKACKNISLDNDAVHSLAQILSLNEKSVDEKSAEVKALIEGFKKIHKPVSKGYGLSGIGALTLLNMSAEEKINAVAEVDDYLKKQKGFKWYNTDQKTRRLFASLIVFVAYASEDNTSLSSTVSSTLTMVMIETIITMLIVYMIICNTSAATNASNGNK